MNSCFSPCGHQSSIVNGPLSMLENTEGVVSRCPEIVLRQGVRVDVSETLEKMSISEVSPMFSVWYALSDFRGSANKT